MEHHDGQILYLCRRDVEATCATIDPVDAVRAAFRFHAHGQTQLPDEAYLPWENSLGHHLRSLNMPAYVGGDVNAAGTKIINSNPANPEAGLPRASGITMLFDVKTARVRCILEGAYLSALRTASVTALCATLLEATPIECVAVVGAGALAAAHLDLLPRYLRSLRCIRLHDLDIERAIGLKQRLDARLAPVGVELTVTSSAEEAIRGAQLVVPVTTVCGEGYIPFSWLSRGTILVNVSLDDVLPEVVLGADVVIVDDWHLVKTDSRRLLGRMYRQGLLCGPSDDRPHPECHPRRIDAEIGDIVIGVQPGRTQPEQIILVNPFGLAIEDIALAAKVVEQAIGMEAGVWLEA